MIIAGIGSRKTSKQGLHELGEVGKFIADRKGWVRSGHAEGADMAFEKSARDQTIVYLPWARFGGPFFTNNVVDFEAQPQDIKDHALAESARYHPNWTGLKRSVQKLMARNYFQVMGTNSKPVDAVVCWADVDRDYNELGGTGQACRIARDNDIPVFNLRYMKLDFVLEQLNRLGVSYARR